MGNCKRHSGSNDEQNYSKTIEKESKIFYSSQSLTIHPQLRTTSESFKKKKKQAQHVAIRTRFILILDKSVIKNGKTVFDSFRLALFNWLRMKLNSTPFEGTFAALLNGV